MESLTTKLHIVFDASAAQKGSLSLNEAIRSAPNLTGEMLRVLLSFWYDKLVITADVERSFPQIIIRERDRDAMRLLQNPDENEDQRRSG